MKLSLKVGKKSILSLFYIDYLMGVFSFNLVKLKNAIGSNDTQNILKYKAAALKNGKIATEYCRKRIATDRAEAYRLMGRYYWLMDKQGESLKWLDKAIREGERLGAKVELSRTYFEVGKSLLEKKSQYRELNGRNAEEYLGNARILFEEMYLQRDLSELDRITP